MTNKPNARSLQLSDYYVIEAIHSMGSQMVATGTYFWTVHEFGFGPVANLLMGTLSGFLYVVCSFLGGRAAERMHRIGLIVAAFVGMSLSLVCLALHPVRWAAFVFLGLYTVFVAFTWPAIEADLVHVPGRLSMPTRLGLYNAVWAWMAVVSVFAGGFLLALDADLLLWVAAGAPLVQIAWIAARYRARGQTGLSAMEIPHRGAEIPLAVRRRFLSFAWVSNSACYLMLAAFSALAPHVGQGLQLNPQKAMWLVGVPFLARGVAFLVFLRWHGWQYRARWSVLSLLLAVATLGYAFLGASLPAVLAALAVFGVCLGLVYSTSIYYSLDVGESKGEHGGLHEAIVGTGILLGPLVGTAGGALLGGARGAELCVIAVAVAVATAGSFSFLSRGSRLSGKP